MRPKPLSGLRVLDLSRLLPGPIATMHLADMGADVIKIEDTGAGDYARSIWAPVDDASTFFRLLNRNKRALKLDLKQPAGVEVFLRLARGADVIVESFRPGVVAKLGIDYERVAASNPRVVYCAISGYGQTGPYASRAGHDINYIAYAGVLDQIGPAGGPPVPPNFQIADLLGGALAPLVGILVAVIDAKASGRGRYVDASMTDAVFAHAIFPLLGLLLRGRTPPRGADTLTGGVPSYGVYETADARYLAVGALEEKFWSALCDTVGRPDLKPYRLAGDQAGEFARNELKRVFASRPLAHWTGVFAEVDCCVTPVLTVEESRRDPQLLARGMPIEVDGLPQFAPPFRLSEFELGAPRPAPRAGADTDEILRELGYGDNQIAALRAREVI